MVNYRRIVANKQNRGVADVAPGSRAPTDGPPTPAAKGGSIFWVMMPPVPPFRSYPQEPSEPYGPGRFGSISTLTVKMIQTLIRSSFSVNEILVESRKIHCGIESWVLRV